MEKKAIDGDVDLVFSDQAGFAPTQPTGYTWAQCGTEKRIPYEAPQGRRVNASGAYRPYAVDGPTLLVETRPAPRKPRKTTTLKAADSKTGTPTATGTYGAIDHLTFLRRVAGVPENASEDFRLARPCVIVQDTYSVHVSATARAGYLLLARHGVIVYQLPSYSPDLNLIEPVWRWITYLGLYERTYTSLAEIEQAVHRAVADCIAMKQPANLPGSP